MENDADAATAISELDGKDLDGRNLKVAEANPPRERSDRGSDRGGDRGRRW
jgi:RNA recognition motif-containing protein